MEHPLCPRARDKEERLALASILAKDIDALTEFAIRLGLETLHGSWHVWMKWGCDWLENRTRPPLELVHNKHLKQESRSSFVRAIDDTWAAAPAIGGFAVRLASGVKISHLERIADCLIYEGDKELGENYVNRLVNGDVA